VSAPTETPKADDFWYSTPSQLPVEPEEPKKDVTMDFWQRPIPQAPVEPEAPVSLDPAVHSAPEQIHSATPDPVPQSVLPKFSQESAQIDAQSDVVPVSPAAPTLEALREAVRAASASSEGKTMSYFSSVASSAAPPAAVPAADPISVTVSAVAPSSAAPYTAPVAAPPVRQGISDPVVGWLVCIQGPCLGWSFQIGAGNNTIGRKEDNRIVVPGDMKISGIRHAAIAYEPKRRNFYLHPGEASGLTYLNDEYITAPQKLSPRDIIELGDTRLLFVPLCGEDFSWEEYLR
jgi:hypothetical protein